MAKKKKKTLFGKLWQGITNNPILAFSLASMSFGAFKNYYPDAYRDTIGFLDMDPKTTYHPGTPTNKLTNVYGQPSTYGKGYNTTEAATDLFGNQQGLFYDFQKGIGQTLAVLPKMGALFSGDGAAYNYLLGRGNFSQLKAGVRDTLPDYLNPAKSAKIGDWGKLWKVYRAQQRFGGGPGGGKGGQQISMGRSRANIGSLSAPSYQSGKITPYDPARLSANLLRTSYQDKYLRFINAPSDRSARTIGPNINFRAGIKVGGRYTRTRT
jgi:hypothetical protein